MHGGRLCRGQFDERESHKIKKVQRSKTGKEGKFTLSLSCGFPKSFPRFPPVVYTDLIDRQNVFQTVFPCQNALIVTPYCRFISNLTVYWNCKVRYCFQEFYLLLRKFIFHECAAYIASVVSQWILRDKVLYWYPFAYIGESYHHYNWGPPINGYFNTITHRNRATARYDYFVHWLFSKWPTKPWILKKYLRTTNWRNLNFDQSYDQVGS